MADGSEPDPGDRRGSVTIYDVARFAGVSPSTVSRALHKPGRISAQTEQRIKDAAESLQYRINPMARALPTGRTGTIGLLVSDFTNPVFFELVRGAESISSEQEHTLVLAESQEEADRELEIAQRLAPSVDGFVLVASRLDDDSIRTIARSKPTVVVNRLVDGVSCVVPDLAVGVQDALEALAHLGHETICYVAGPTTSWMSRHRAEVLVAGAEQRGQRVHVLPASEPTLEGGRAAWNAIVDSGATAAVAYNDLMAIGVLRAARTAGVRVPDELSIVGFDDIFGTELTTPSITTVRTPLGDLGRSAVIHLLATISGQPDGDSPALSTTFIARGSIGSALR